MRASSWTRTDPSLGSQASAGASAADTWRLDLLTDDGRAAHAALLRGAAPDPSAAVMGPLTDNATTAGSAFNVAVPGASLNIGAQADRRTTQHLDGSTTVTDQGVGSEGHSWWRWANDWLPSFALQSGLHTPLARPAPSQPAAPRQFS